MKGVINMDWKEVNFSKIFFKHAYFYYEPKSFIFPISLIIDKFGITLCFAFFGVVWYWNEINDD